MDRAIEECKHRMSRYSVTCVVCQLTRPEFDAQLTGALCSQAQHADLPAAAPAVPRARARGEDPVRRRPCPPSHTAAAGSRVGVCTPARHRFIEGGERAVTKFEEGVAGYESRAYRGLGVFTSTPVQHALEHPDPQSQTQLLVLLVHRTLHGAEPLIRWQRTVPSQWPAGTQCQQLVYWRKLGLHRTVAARTL